MGADANLFPFLAPSQEQIEDAALTAEVEPEWVTENERTVEWNEEQWAYLKEKLAATERRNALTLTPEFIEAADIEAETPFITNFENVMCGNCLDLLPTLAPSSADLLVCDPPFNIGYKYDKYKDNLEDAEYLEWSKKWIEAAKRVLKPNGTFWVVIGDKYVSEIDIICKAAGFTRRSFVVWHYTFGQASQTNFTPSHTNLLYYVMDPKSFTFNPDCIRVPSARQLKYKDKRANPKGKLPDNVWDISRLCGTFKERVKHSCQLPLELTDRIIKSTSNPGDLVVDPMCGSGSVLVSAAMHDRRYLGIELSDNYVQVAKSRLSELKAKEVCK